MNKSDIIFVAGANGMVGSAFRRLLEAKGFQQLLCPSSAELDLTNQQSVIHFFERNRPKHVILAAAKVGGIKANNTFRGDFLYENLMIQNNVIHAAKEFGVQKLLFLGSSCIYPKNAPQPLKEEYLLSGELETTNEPYAVAKISGIKLCENYYRQYGCDFISIMPTNLFGENDNFDLETSHVVPALTRKFHLAKLYSDGHLAKLKENLNAQNDSELNEKLQQIGIKNEQNNAISVSLWGSGKAKREFMYVDDFVLRAYAILEKLSAKQLYDELMVSHINVGTGEEISIAELAEKLKNIIGFDGDVKWTGELEGTEKKRLDISLLKKIDGEMRVNLEKRLTENYQLYVTRNGR